MDTGEQNITDMIAVSTLIDRFFRFCDTFDAEGLTDCLTEDVDTFHTVLGSIKGRTSFVEAAMHDDVPELKATQHYCMNKQITVHGDSALCLSNLYAQNVVSVNGEDVLMPAGGYYTHECVRTEQGWRIMRLRNDVTWKDPQLANVFAPSILRRSESIRRNPE